MSINEERHLLWWSIICTLMERFFIFKHFNPVTKTEQITKIHANCLLMSFFSLIPKSHHIIHKHTRNQCRSLSLFCKIPDLLQSPLTPSSSSSSSIWRQPVFGLRPRWPGSRLTDDNALFSSRWTVLRPQLWRKHQPDLGRLACQHCLRPR